LQPVNFRAKAMILLGEEFSAEQALGWGVVWKVVEDNELGAVSRDIAGRLAGLDADVVARYKRVLNEIGLPTSRNPCRGACWPSVKPSSR
jgi:2-(1,2-epoxy-1,2-dihydrophenyl)acetyl-CoA isomerase